MPLNVSSSYQTLDNFYPGEENLEAFIILQGYIDNPAGDVLFLLGPQSCGKSHLLRGVVNKFCSSSELKVTLLTSESLKNRFVVAIRDNTIAEFWDDLLNVDVLIVDDCQFLSYGIDDVIAQLCEIYQRKNKRLILAGDYLLESLRVIPNLKVLGLVRPGYDARKRILHEKLNEMAVVMNEDLENLIAKRAEDPRQIQGFVSWLCANQDCL